MKQFSCGDVVPGCGQQFRGRDEAEILAAVGHHAAVAHGMSTVPEPVVAQVRARIVPVARSGDGARGSPLLIAGELTRAAGGWRSRPAPAGSLLQAVAGPVPMAQTRCSAS